MAGIPDVICIVSGRFVGLEVKRPHLGRLTALQAAMLRRINQAGGYGVVVHSVEEAVAAAKAAARGESAPEEYR